MFPPLLLLTLSTGCVAPDEPSLPEGALRFAGGPPRRLLMLSIDTLRRDAVGRYGSAGESDTPFLDGLIGGGVALDDHVSCSSWTYPSMLCALSGRSTTDIGFEPLHDPAGEPLPLPDGQVELLADQLGRAGFDTALVSTNPFIHDSFGMTSGYRQRVLDTSLDAAGVVDHGLDLLDGVDRERWLLHLHFVDPHSPYDPPEAYLDGLDDLPPIGVDLTSYPAVEALADTWTSLPPDEVDAIEAHARLRYAGLARYVDDQIARLFSELDASGALDGTLVWLMTDHGEQFWEHDALGHGVSLYREENAAVAVFWSPDLIPGVWSSPTTHADLLPTALTALELDLLPTTGAPVGYAPPSRPLLAQIYQRGVTRQAVIQGGDKLIFDWAGIWWLYTVGDPGETRNHITEDPVRAAELWALLRPETEALQALYPDYAPDLSQAP